MGYQRAEETSSLHTVDLRGRLVFPAGLLPRAIAVLESNGHSVEVEDRRTLGKNVLPDLLHGGHGLGGRVH